METEFCTYEQSLALKELGFDKPCFKVKLKDKPQLDYTPSDYDDFPEQKEVEVGIPLFQQAFRFFRDKHNLLGTINISKQGFFYYDINKIEPYQEIYQGVDFDIYEETEEACLDKLIEICKNK